jgi:tRNA(Ile)-lysidine synthase TilS/MesJ
MLQITKQDCYDICKLNAVPFVEDQTNQDNNITRNAIRNQVVPVLKNIFPNCAENANRVAKNAADAQKVIEHATKQLRLYQDANSLRIKLVALQLADDLVIYEWIRDCCFCLNESFNVDSLNKEQIDKMIHAIRSSQKKKFDLPDNIKVIINKDIVEIM